MYFVKEDNVNFGMFWNKFLFLKIRKILGIGNVF